MEKKRRFSLRSLTWSWDPKNEREAGDAVVRNFLLHWFPNKVTKRGLQTRYSMWLGVISFFLFIILTLTGVVLMFLYVPSVERAYGSIKDLEYQFSFGAFLRATHRMAAHLMVISVFLHMVRVFLTAAFKNGVLARQNRPLNWWIGLVMLLLTLLLSFTGYLLPWDQLAYWAITVGTNIANAVPLVGEETRFFLLGGLMAWHMWRIRKDGGLACHDQLAQAQKAAAAPPTPAKTYSLLGITEGRTADVEMSVVDEERDLVQAIPVFLRRLIVVGLLTFAARAALAVWLGAPLEEAANPDVTPNPAKAPWYFLWLQELVTITTVRIFGWTINGALIGGVIVPGVLFVWAFVVPWLDKSGPAATGVWFHKERRRANLIFLLMCLALLVLTIVGTFLRGPYWDFFWPWEAWPAHPGRY